MWSPDVDPPSTGHPVDPDDFSVFLQLRLGVPGERGGEVFSLQVRSPNAMQRVGSGSFVSNTLVLDHFDWSAIRARIEKVLDLARGSRDWSEVIQRLSGFLKHEDAA